ncbi:MAG: hypothetical protein ACI30K_01550, partial [Muribaculaceae bacterium]
TNAFKQWFGDWEKAARIEAIKGLSPIAIKPHSMQKDELYSIYKELKTVSKDGHSISFYNSAFKKNFKENGLFAQIVPQLREIFENSIFAYEEEDMLGGTIRSDGTMHKEHKNIVSYQNYVGKVKIDGKDYYVRYTVQEEKSGLKGTHSFFVSNVDIYENPTEKRTIPITSRGTTEFDGIVDAKLQQFFEMSNNSSQVVDENGEPRIVYHGTKRQFWVFDGGKTKGVFDDGLNYFSLDRDFSERWINRDDERQRSPEDNVKLEEARQLSMQHKRETIKPIIEKYGPSRYTEAPEYRELEKEWEQWERDNLGLDGMTLKEAKYDYGKRLLECYISAKNIYNPKEKYETEGRQMLINLGIINPNETGREKAMTDLYASNGSYLYYERKAVVDELKRRGYDGILITEDVSSDASKNLRTLAVWDPTKIKSATDNVGTFDAENPDIRYQIVGEKGAASLDKAKKLSDEEKPKADENKESGLRFRDGDARDVAQRMDDNNGTEVVRFVDFMRRGRLEQGESRYFHVGETGDILNEHGISGKITIGTSAVNSHHNEDKDHLDEKDWVEVIEKINEPVAITEYGDRGNSYRIYTIVEKNGKNICVGVDVNSVGRDVNITNIRTAFARDIVNVLNERLVYPHSRSELETAIRKLSLRHNREVYPEQPYDAVNIRNNSETQAQNEENLLYRIREDEPPTQTGIGYKVFVLKDGKLYPPMVANPGGEATPIGVWLDADAAPVAGVTKTGRQQVKAGGKGTQGGSGKLAYRPGWHLGEIPYALQFNRINPKTGQRELFPANFVWAEVEYANDVDYQDEAMSYGMNKSGKFQHSLAGLPRLPKDGSYKYRTNPDPNTDDWIITGAMKVNRILKPSEVDAMVEGAGRKPQPRQAGAVTDAQVESLNSEIERINVRQKEIVQTSHEAKRKAAERLGAKLNTKVNIVSDISEI